MESPHGCTPRETVSELEGTVAPFAGAGQQTLGSLGVHLPGKGLLQLIAVQEMGVRGQSHGMYTSDDLRADAATTHTRGECTAANVPVLSSGHTAAAQTNGVQRGRWF